ncbi:MAG: exodeoxyribonuclease VII large subunit [Alphaproteobacteria bacterium]|jgi:exodeoxyribonuclease VII large subunit
MSDLFSYADKTPEAQAEKVKPAKENILTVSQLSNQLRMAIEGKFSSLAVEGEISGLKIAASGHVYFDLKDDDNLIKAIVWRGQAEKIKCKLEDGLQVVVHGKLTTYGARSNYQLIVSRIAPAGMGALMQRFEEIKAKLASEGLFDADLKQKIPFIPQKIAIITSPTGAVLDDMLHRIRDRFPSHIVLYPTLVQGVGAKEQIAAGLAYFNNLPVAEHPDVIIVARGGGSLEDLWAFNEEVVVRAVAASAIPVISAVGHEPDTTLCDYAADLRAPTPTAAAEMVVPVRADLVYTISLLRGKLEQTMLSRISYSKKHLKLMVQTLGDPLSLLNQARLRLDERSERFIQSFSSFTKLKKQRFDAIQGRLSFITWQTYKKVKQDKLQALDKRLTPSLLKRQLHVARERLNEKEKLLISFSPEGPLRRGYAYISSVDGAIIRQKSALKDEDIKIHFIDGDVLATVNSSDKIEG